MNSSFIKGALPPEPPIGITPAGQNCSVSSRTCFSLKRPGWTVCHRPSACALILNLCDINHFHIKGSCLSVPACHHVEVSNHWLVEEVWAPLLHHRLAILLPFHPNEAYPDDAAAFSRLLFPSGYDVFQRTSSRSDF